jgi:hypothetical protein
MIIFWLCLRLMMVEFEGRGSCWTFCLIGQYRHEKLHGYIIVEISLILKSVYESSYCEKFSVLLILGSGLFCLMLPLPCMASMMQL